MKKILVTGGRGFIGSHVVENLVQKGYQVTIFDRFLTSKNEYIPEGVNVFMGDIADEPTISEAVFQHDGVIHLAGILGTAETIADPMSAIRTNILGGYNVFQAIKKHKRKAVNITVGNHWMNNPYAITKSTAERLALMFNVEYGTQIAVVRGLNGYGPRQKPYPVRKLVPNLVIPALKGEELILYGDGQQIMDLIFVEDLAEILVRALVVEHNHYNHIFEAGNGERTTVLDIAQRVINKIGTGKIVHAPMRAGEVAKAVVLADTTTLAPLGKLELTPIDQGLDKTIEWYKQHYG